MERRLTKEKGLVYEHVETRGEISIYRVSLPGAEETGWNGNQGYRARTTIRIPVYEEGHRNMVGYVNREIEVVVNGLSFGKAARKLKVLANHLSQNCQPGGRTMPRKKRIPTKTRKKNLMQF